MLRRVLRCLALLAAAVAARAETVLAEAPVAAGQTHTVIDFAVPAMADGAYLTLEFSLRPALRAARLLPPSGPPQELGAAALNTLQAAERRQRERGDLHLLKQPLREPAPGRWRLELRHEPAAAATTALLQVGVFPRYALRLERVGGVQPAAGNEQVLLLYVSEYGLPRREPAPQLEWRGPDGLLHEIPLVAAASERQPLTQVTGAYVGRFVPQLAGTQRLLAEFQPPGATRPVKAELSWELQAATAPADLPLAMRFERGPDGCWQRVRFVLRWQASRRGLHALNVRLAGPQQELFVNGSAEVARPGPVELVAVLDAARARQWLQGRLERAAAVTVLHHGGDTIDALLMRRAVPLPEALDVGAACSAAR
ncbi:MAG: hypothetical protein QM702_22870 [Rubrivivax sp.]